MKNKILAGVVASVMAVTMLGTVSFAKTIGVTPDATITGAQRTALAYVTNDPTETTFADADIVAVIQQSSAVTEIPVSETRMADKDYMVVKFGGTDGVTHNAVVALGSIADVLSVNVYDQMVMDGTTYNNVAFASCEYTAASAVTVTDAGVEFTTATAGAVPQMLSWKEDGTDTTVNVAAGGKFVFGALVYGLSETVTGTVVAEPYVVTVAE